MSRPIEPGDWVECIQNRRPTTLPPLGLVVGRVYRVADVGVTPLNDVNPGVAWVRLVAPEPRAGKLGFRAAWFRPIYRPSEDSAVTLAALAPSPEVSA